MLPIRQTINALPSLKRTEKVVLIEVCQLAENSELAGWCTAKNNYLVQALGGTERTMSRTLTALESRGLLLSKGQGKARKMAPTAALRTCYAEPDGMTRRAAVAALNLDKSGHEPRQSDPSNLDISGANLDTSGANLDKNSPEPRQNDEVEADQPRQNGSVNLDKSGHEPRQNGSRVIGDQHYQQFTSTPPTPEEWEGAQKKIVELELEVSRLKAENLKLVPPVAASPQQPAIEEQGPRYSETSLALATTMAELWSISRMPRHGGLWGLLCRYTYTMEQQGKLSQAATQFDGYRLHRQKRGLGPHDLKDYLGSEGGGFEGIWCQYNWPSKAAQARTEGDPIQAQQSARASTSARKSQTQEW